MKNTITINANEGYIVDCIDSIYDGSNTLYLHFLTTVNLSVAFSGHGSQTITPQSDTIQIPSSWFLTSDLTFTVGGVTFTIKHPTLTTGNMTMAQVNDTTYQINFYESGGGGSYTLPIATASILGGVKIGTGIREESDGTINVDVDETLDETSTNAIQNAAVTARMNEVFTSVSNGKALIASVITDKGIPTEATETFAQMANKIRTMITWKTIDISYKIVSYTEVVE